MNVKAFLTYGDVAQPHVPTAFTDASGISWNFSHNAFGQVTAVTPPAGSPLGVPSVVYDTTIGSSTFGYTLSATDGSGNLATYDQYDAQGNLLKASTYPIAGNTSVKNTETLTYDAAQRVTSATHPDGHLTQSVFNKSFLNYTLDEANTKYSYTFCPTCGALEKITGPLSWSLSQVHDKDRQTTSFTDARGKITKYIYGVAGELTQIKYPDNSTGSLLYDNLSRIRQTTNARGNSFSLGYDLADRVTSVTAPGTQASYAYAYNNDDTPNTVTDGVGTTTYHYLPNKRVSSMDMDYTASGLTDIQHLEYVYYPDGLRQTLTWKSGANVVGVWNYQYDGAGRLTGLTNAWGETSNWSYDGEGKLTSQTNANGTRLDVTYNQARGWATNLTNKSGGIEFSSYALAYDAGLNTVGNLTGVTEPNGTSTYTYDALYRMTKEVRTGTGANTYTHTYDLAGNRTKLDTLASTL